MLSSRRNSKDSLKDSGGRQKDKRKPKNYWEAGTSQGSELAHVLAKGIACRGSTR